MPPSLSDLGVCKPSGRSGACDFAECGRLCPGSLASPDSDLEAGGAAEAGVRGTPQPCWTPGRSFFAPVRHMGTSALGPALEKDLKMNI